MHNVLPSVDVLFRTSIRKSIFKYLKKICGECKVKSNKLDNAPIIIEEYL